MVTYLYRTRCGLEQYTMTGPRAYLPRSCTHRDCDRQDCAWSLVGRRSIDEYGKRSISLYVSGQVADDLSRALGQALRRDDLEDLGFDRETIQALKIQIDTARRGWLDK